MRMTKDKKNKLIIFLMILILVGLLILIVSKSILKNENEKKNENSNKANDSETTKTLETTKKNAYGDYVDYPIDLDGDGKTTDDWKIFYRDDERVYLITADYLETDSKYVDFKKLEMEKQDVYGAFWRTAPTKYDRESELVNARCVQSLLDTDNWTDFVDSKCADYALGAPTIELWAKSWNERYGKSKVFEYGMDEYGYYLGTNETKPDYIMDLSSVAGYKDSLYFPHSSVFKLSTGYWLASPSSNKVYNIVTVNYNGMIGNEDYKFSTCALRPVVALKTGITAKLNESTGIWELTRKK